MYAALGYIPDRGPGGLEIDEYDTRAEPAGAFDPASGALIGGIRLILTEPQPAHERAVRQIVAGSGDAELARRALARPAQPFPSVVSGAVLDRVQAFNTSGFALYELSRTIVAPAHQGKGLARGLIEFGIACAARRGPATIVGSCLPAHVPMHARYGFAPLPSGDLESFASVGQHGYVLIGRSDRLPEPTRANVSELLPSLSRQPTIS